MSDTSGFFISFESIDGVGKTTQVRLLNEALTGLGFDTLMTKEPGDANMGSNIGAGIRELLFKAPTTHRMHPGVADSLFLADHIQTSGDIAAAVHQGKVVICDRYADSQFAYASSSSKQCPPWALKAYEENFGIIPDLTILLVARGPQTSEVLPVKWSGSTVSDCDEDIQWALDRAQARLGPEAGKQGAKAWNTVAEQRRIQAAYINRIGSESRTWIIHVWKDDSVETIHSQILKAVLARLGYPLMSLLTSPESNYAASM